jgi:hypothetical protein
MTHDDVIRFAKKAGLSVKDPQFGWSEEHHIAGWITELEVFAKLVAAQATEHEREACAKLVSDIEWKCIMDDVDDTPLKEISKAIRARGQA